MSDQSLEQYKLRVEELGQALLDIIASVSMGDYDVNLDLPDDIEVFADLAVGLEFMIEDLRELGKEQEKSRKELEGRIARRTNELEKTLADLQDTQRQMLNEGWEDYIAEDDSRLGLYIENGQVVESHEKWLPHMTKAIQDSKTTYEANGNNTQSLALPIKFQNQVIGVIGFESQTDTIWEENDIEIVESIVEQVGLALENQRLFDRTQAALAETDTLYQASAELNIAQSYDQILAVFNKYSIFGHGAKNLLLSFFDSPWTMNHIPTEITILSQISPEETPLEQNDQLFQALLKSSFLKSDVPKIISDIYSDSVLDFESRSVIRDRHQAQGAAFLPLVAGGSWIGLITALYSEVIDFPEEEIRKGTALSTQVSVAAQNLRSIELSEDKAEEAQSRSEELELVNRIVSKVVSSMDLAASLQVVVDELNNAIGVDETEVSLLNPEKTHLTVIADTSKVPGATSSVGTMVPLAGNSPTQQVLDSKSSIVISREQADERTAVIHEIMQDRDHQTTCIFPLVAGDEAIGTLAIATTNPDMMLSPEDMRLVETIVLQASTAIQNARLFEQTQTALTETANLYQASAELNIVQSFNDILNVLKNHTILAKSEGQISLYLFSEPWARNEIPDSMAQSSEWISGEFSTSKLSRLKFSDLSGVEQFMNADEIIMVDKNSTDTYAYELAQKILPKYDSDKSFISVPFVTAGRWIGQILATLPSDVEISATQNRQLMALAGQSAIAMVNIGLLEETERRANQLETAALVARESSSTLDLNVLLNKAVNLIRDQFGYYHASIFLVEGEYAVVKASTGEAGKQLVENAHSLKMQEGTSIIGHVTYSGEALVVNDVTADPTHRPHPLLPDTRGELGIPLKIGDRVTGAVDVQSTDADAFTEDDIAVLQILADQIAVAVDNARSFEVAQKAVEEMREIDRLKSEFLANMSHELRTPLNSIIGFSRVILKGIDGPINDLQEQDLQAIHNSGQHLLDMINDILDLSKIEAGKMELSLERVNLEEVITSVISTATGLVKEKEIRLINNAGDNLPEVIADRTRIRQILLNLLQNAVKFTEEGSITLDVESFHHQELDLPYLKLSVKDSGIGISQEDQDSLFERFSQVDSSLTRKVGGSGLGLSISRHLVNLQNGEIGVESEMGKGSMFYFTLPVAPPEESSPETPQETIPQIQEVAVNSPLELPDMESPQPGNEDKGQKITDPQSGISNLQEVEETVVAVPDIKENGSVPEKSDQELSAPPVNVPNDDKVIISIDDDDKIISLYERYLSSRGYQIVPITNPNTALEKIKEVMPFAITLDIMMPDRDGWQIIEDVQADPETKDIPIIICSIVEDREKGFKLGAADYLVKPILEEELVNSLNKLKETGSNDIHNILVIDDDPDVMRLIEKTVSDDTSIRFHYSDGGVNGLAAMKNKIPDAVILDIHMPDVDGFGILEAMKNDPSLRDIPVIILTGADLNNDELDRIKGFDSQLYQKSSIQEHNSSSSLAQALKNLQ